MDSIYAKSIRKPHPTNSRPVEHSGGLVHALGAGRSREVDIPEQENEELKIIFSITYVPVPPSRTVFVGLSDLRPRNPGSVISDCLTGQSDSLTASKPFTSW